MNHYKLRFLNHLALEPEVELTVLSGTGRSNMGDQELKDSTNFKQINLDVPKKDFGTSKLVKGKLKELFSDFDWIMIPVEKKNVPLFLFALKLKKQHQSVQLFSYNHPILKSKQGKVTLVDKWLTRWFFKKLDRVVFYTKQSHEWAVSERLIAKEKAFWANNTIDTSEIQKHHTYQLPNANKISILFIGRLIASKRIPELLEYYARLKQDIPNLELDIIGDGPESYLVKEASELDTNIHWHGTLIDEEKIAPIMQRASLVFIPGHSGLSVNHAFAYGRPYITLEGPSHAPEVDYIDQAENGFMLHGTFDENIEVIKHLLLDKDQLKQFCDSAKEKGNYLSVENWVNQMKSSLLDEG
ncbi:glycosyltransferase family 4 protein [Psychroserpens sp. XS_ASV72]|uniref:glycosyltransferase family 4 protein n=1 Tax=Psychroserpens sp. XS_ASV72 TaxID=3241293 RepID=UPI00351887FF